MGVTAVRRPRSAVPAAAVALVLAITSPVHAGEPAAAAPAAAEPAPPSTPPPPGSAPEKTWDDVLAESQPPAVAPTPAPAPQPAAPAELPRPALQRPSDIELADGKRTGTGLLIGAGVSLAIGTALNGLRVYLVTVPCQTPSQVGCSLGWFLTTPFTFAANIAGASLAGAGARERGIVDAWTAAERHRQRAPVMLSLGIPLIVLGVATSISLRALWLSDYVSPEGVPIFDFARPSHAFGYYGGQQISALAVAAGLGMVTYHTAGARVRRRRALASPWLSPQVLGVQVSSRF